MIFNTGHAVIWLNHESSLMNNQTVVDLLIIGGGINGAGIAVDAIGRGLSVMLCEKADLASGTSWKSSKLIHGGLRYLEYYEFRLVQKALKEREVLLRKAPHIIRPLRFIMPYVPQLRPAWIIRLGLFLYDHLGKRKILPHSYKLNLRQDIAGKPLKENYSIGFSYADCYVDDARLVIVNAIQAKNLGANILTHTEVIAAERHTDHWMVTIKNNLTHVTQSVRAKMLVNAAGPWVEQLIHRLHIPAKHHLALVKGSHIVVPKLYSTDDAYLLQCKDKRVVFVIPFAENYSLIGTTDLSYAGPLDNIEIEQSEIDYLLTLTNQFFQRQLQPTDIIWSFAGVRPLLNNHANNLSAITRDYYLEFDHPSHEAPMLTVFGGKITTYRELAESAMSHIGKIFPHLKPAWTANAPLPGGDIPNADFTAFLQQTKANYPWLPETTLQRYAHQYGTLVSTLLDKANSLEDLGELLGADLYEREVEYLVTYEWAQTADDILWRRTKLGLVFPQQNIEKLTSCIAKKVAPIKT